MYLPGTEMHMITFSIVIVELVILLFQLIHFLERPSDRQRFWFLILIYLLIQYNVFGGIFPAADIPIPIPWQNILAYGSAIAMSMYFAFYFYKAYELEHFRWFAIYGVFYFVFIPFIAIFSIPYLLTGNLEVSVRLFLVIPFLYCIVFLFFITRAVRRKYHNALNGPEGALYKERILCVYIALTFWLALPIITYFDAGQVWEVVITNAGFLIMMISYLRTSIYYRKAEYRKLQESENTLQQLNRELQAKVKERTRDLERLLEFRKNSFINLAHETKTPLTLINNYLDHYIQKYGYNEELMIIKHNLDKMSTDVVNFFDLERFEQGIEVYDHNQVSDFSRILSDSLVLFKTFATNKNITITEEVDPGLLIFAAPEALHRLINNLIENAIKYTSRDGKVHVELKRHDSVLLFSVNDNGMGIPKGMNHKVFEPYYQIQRQKTNSEGMGMGLSIVKNIVKSLDGKIQLESREEFGTKVTVELPYVEVPDQQAEDFILSDSKPLFQFDHDIEDSLDKENAPHILIVEDNISMLSYLHLKLKERYNVLTAKNGVEALEKLKTTTRIDLIVSDVMMDKMDGFTFFRVVKSDKKFSHLPFIFLTAKVTKEDKLKGLSLGAIDYIDKPFSIEHLIGKINSVLSNLDRQKRAFVNQAYNSLLSGSSTSLDFTEDRPAATRSTLEVEASGFDTNTKTFGLSKREIEISKLLLEGYTQARIGEQLSISEKTVKTHVQNIFGKVGVNNKVELGNRLRQ